MPAGYKIPAHHHPTTEYVTVLSDAFYIGMGDKLDEQKGIACGLVDAAYVEANTPIVREQLQKAGVRLAHMLDAALGK